MGNIIDGKTKAAAISQAIKLKVKQRRNAGLRVPGLAVVIVGNEPASLTYVTKKLNACKEVGFISKNYHFDATISGGTLLKLINYLNNDSAIDGILVQLPLPLHVNTEKILETIYPDKDVDGFHPYNVGKLIQRKPILRSCTPKGIMILLKEIQL